MNIIRNEVKSGLPVLSEKIDCLIGLRPAVIDIETTGLSYEKSFIYLIGVLHDSDRGMVVTQFLADSKEDEAEVLEAFFDFIENFDIFLNYNGNAFDIPFINRRSEKLGKRRKLNVLRSVDYLRLFKTSYIKDILPNMKLSMVEKLAGVFREDPFSGKECIELYRRYSKCGDREAGRSVLLHNYEDLSCFPALNTLVEKIDYHMAFLKTGFPVRAGSAIYFVTDVKITAAVKVKGIAEGLEMDEEIYGADYKLKSHSLKGNFALEFNIEEDEEGVISSVVHRKIISILKEVHREG